MEQKDSPMEQYLNENLLPDETVKWTGRPTNIKLMEKPMSNFVILRWVISALLLVFTVWYWTFALAHGFEISLPVTLTVILVLVAAWVAVSPLISNRRAQSKCLYAITNKRALILYKTIPIITRVRELDTVTDSSYDTLSTGCGNIYVGAKTKNAPGKARDMAFVSDMPDDELPLIFFSVEDPASVFALLNAREARHEDEEGSMIA